MSALPDTLDFTVRALTARGALMDASDSAAIALLPTALATELGVGEEITVAPLPSEGTGVMSCGVGSSLLEKLTSGLRREAPWTAVAPVIDPPRVSHATSMAARLVVRNGLAEVLDASTGTGWYARLTEAWAVEADDRYEGLAHAHASPGGGEPDGAVQSMLDLSEHEHSAATELPDAATRQALVERMAPRVTAALAAEVVAPLASIEHRHARDHGRMAEYFDGLVRELTLGRRKVDPAVVASRAATIVAERDTRMRDLVLRYTPRVTVIPAALVFGALPVVRVRLRVLRRKTAGELWVTLPAGAGVLDALRCDGCEGSTARPALCDDRLHCLCEKCVPQTTGRFACSACQRGSGRRGG